MSKGKKSPLKLIIVGLVCFFLVFTLAPRIKTVMILNERKAKLVEQQKQLEKENTRLTEELENVYTSEAVEKIAREQLGMVKEGEMPVLKITRDENK
ncbi:MAG: septum formation initiator family protein [Syntrophomonadaceae bacterium]|nr:septum formation initiator family protein [Syntrophomonadaceae bacterium]MDD4548940.1 septum formation initiator family protein [Syntrophomonadaceae bacterium]